MSAFLIIYLWHASGVGGVAGGTGGPVFQVVPMPSIAVCETVGMAAKELADGQRLEPVEGPLFEASKGDIRWATLHSPPMVYRCVRGATR